MLQHFKTTCIHLVNSMFFEYPLTPAHLLQPCYRFIDRGQVSECPTKRQRTQGSTPALERRRRTNDEKIDEPLEIIWVKPSQRHRAVWANRKSNTYSYGSLRAARPHSALRAQSPISNQSLDSSRTGPALKS